VKLGPARCERCAAHDCSAAHAVCAVLEVILSALDRDLIPANPAAASLAQACQQQQQQQQQQQSSSSIQPAELLPAVGRYPAGYAPAAASSEELLEAFKVLQVSVSHSHTRFSLVQLVSLLGGTLQHLTCRGLVCVQHSVMLRTAGLWEGNKEGSAAAPACWRVGRVWQPCESAQHAMCVTVRLPGCAALLLTGPLFAAPQGEAPAVQGSVPAAGHSQGL
jgi:hypothetical protein